MDRPRAKYIPNHGSVTSLLWARGGIQPDDAALMARTINGNQIHTKSPWKHYQQLFRVQGHISSVFCASFDRSSSRIITGSDDYLIKIWNAETGWLIHTLRGHQDVVVDVAVNEEGTLVASASQDNSVRVWDIKTGFPVAVLSSRVTARKGFTALQFSPAPLPAMRYLLVAGEDGNARLWKWDKDTLNFEDATPIVLDCKSTQRDEARCCSFNNTGSRFVIGGTDGLVRLFAVKQNGEVVLMDVLGTGGERHAGHVTVVHFSRDGKGIVSGGADACINVWKLVGSRWRGHRIDLKPLMLERALQSPRPPRNLPRNPPENPLENVPENLSNNAPEDVEVSPTFVNVERPQPIRRNSSNVAHAMEPEEAEDIDEVVHPDSPMDAKKVRISVLCWSVDSAHIITASSDRMIRVFSNDGELKHTLVEHDDECFVLCGHPIDPRLVLSAGHDGRVVLWDIIQGAIVWKATLDYPILEAKFSDDAFRIVVSDSWGSVTMFGFEDEKRYEGVPLEQFFATDYAGLAWDDHLYVADLESGLLPHLMPRLPVGNSGGGVYHERVGKEREGLDLPIEPPHGILQSMEDDRKALLQQEPVEEEGVVDLETVKSKKRRRVEYESDDEEMSAIFNEVAAIEASDNDEDYSGHESMDEPEAEFFDDEDSEHFTGSSDDDTPRRTRKHPGPSSPNVHLRKRVRKTYLESDEEPSDPAELLENVPSAGGEGEKPRRNRPTIKPEMYQPTSWISETVQKSVPYRPQMMDCVVYLASGHERWYKLAMEGLGEAEDWQVPPVNEWMKDKLTPPKQGDSVVFCKIVGLEYEMGPPAYCRVVLQTCYPTLPGSAPSRLNPMWSQKILPEELQDSREQWECAWFDKPGAADFIVPLHRYLESMQTHYAVGDRVLIDFEEGDAEGALMKQPENREDPWASWTVKWEDDQEELFSPWEFVKEGETLHPSPGLTEAQKMTVLELLDSVMPKREWMPFVVPVDKTRYPRYYRTTPFPICLEQIRQRVEGGWYRSSDHLVWELKRLQLNAMEFNPSGTALHTFASTTLDTFIARVNGILDGRSLGAVHRPARKITIKLKLTNKNVPLREQPKIRPNYAEPPPFEDEPMEMVPPSPDSFSDEDPVSDYEQDDFMDEMDDEIDDEMDDFVESSDDEPRRRSGRSQPTRNQPRRSRR